MGQGKAELWQHGGSMTKKEGSGCFPNPLIFLVGRMGIEPTTNGLKVAFPGKDYREIPLASQTKSPRARRIAPSSWAVASVWDYFR